MPANKQDIQQKLQRLRQQYAQKLPARISALEQQWQTLNPSPQAAQYESLIREFHSLAGSGTSFGFPQVTALSREIENILLGAKSINVPLSEQIKADINTKLASLYQAATQDQESSYEEKL